MLAYTWCRVNVPVLTKGLKDFRLSGLLAGGIIYPLFYNKERVAVVQTAYQEALDYIYSFLDFEKKPAVQQSVHWDLRRVSALLERLGDPHLAAKTVHIAGTKGKGSVAAMMASALTAAGYVTGLYTSPHLHSYNERIRIGSTLISDEEIVALVARLKPEIAAVNREAKYGLLTAFEVTTVLAFIYFQSKKVDFQVIETGLGGRLDATNVVSPEVSVITSISLDHTKVLGDTLTLIATEKAGIIKPGKPVVVSPQSGEVDEVIEQACRKSDSKLIKVGRDVTWEFLESWDERQSLRVSGRLGSYDLTITLLGRHQLENAAAAAAALEILREKGFNITPQNMRTGFARVDWPGRMQVLCRQPLIVVDGAHNRESAARLKQALKEYFKFEKAILLIGVSVDKDFQGIASELAPMFNKVISTNSFHPRAMAAAALAAEFQKMGITADVTKDISEALPLAKRLAGPNDLICVTGSLFVVAGAIEEVRRMGCGQNRR